jgi:hypothetical protein
VTTAQKEMHPLSILHLVAMIGLLSCWSIYFWRHSPVREVLASRPAAAESHSTRTSGARLENKARVTLSSGTERVRAAVGVALADIASGLLFLILFGVATGIYIRRFEIWLQARSSGDTMNLAGAGLSDQALAANATRSRSRP